MEKAAKIMYIIGKIKNIIELIVCGIIIVLGVMMMVNPSAFLDVDPKNLPNIASIIACGLVILVVGIIVLAIDILELIFVDKALAQLKSGNNNSTPHIVMLIFGVIGTDIFYLLGGIFGIVFASQKK